MSKLNNWVVYIMNKKQMKSFIIIEIIIYIITTIAIFLICYLMKDMEWWQLMITLFTILICSTVISSLNMVFHIKKK